MYAEVTGSDNEESAAVLEEQEALNLQRKMAAELDDMDFGLDIFKVNCRHISLLYPLQILE